MTGCKADDEIAMAVHCRAKGRDQASIWRAGEFLYSTLDFAGVASANRNNVGTESGGHRLNDRKLPDTRGHGRIPNDADADDRGRDLLEQLQPFAGRAVIELHETGNVAAGMREAL